MNPPDWKTCDENELWRYVAWHLEGEGISSVLVGGAVVSIYTGGAYRSGDLDMIIEGVSRSLLPAALAKIGFKPGKSRYYRHPECEHLCLEFPKGPVEVGEQFDVVPAEIAVEGRVIKLLSPTDCVKDRLASHIHWKSKDAFNQAVLVCRKQGSEIDMKELSDWCDGEGGSAAFRKLLLHLKNTP
jgi:hypothetical protein